MSSKPITLDPYGGRGPMPNKIRYLFGIGDFGANLYNVLMNYFLLVFYTDVFGISPMQAGTLMLVARIWDAVNDPVMGLILDRTAAKEGRSRFWLARMAIPAGIFICLVFTTPNLSNTGKLIWAYVTYMGMDMFITATGISYTSLLARVSRTPLDRVHLQRSRNIFGLIVGLFATGFTTSLVNAVTAGNQQTGYTIVAAGYGAVMAICYFLVVWVTKGEDPPLTEAQVAAAKEKGATKRQLMAMLKNDLWMMLCVITLVFSFNSLLGQTIMAYYTRLCMGQPQMMAYAAVVARIGSFMNILLCGWFAKKLGRSKTAIMCLSIQFCVALFRFITKDANGYVMLGCMFINGMVSSMFLMMHVPTMMDSIEYGEWKTGIRSDGLVMSGSSLATKIGNAVGSASVAYLLGFSGYDAALKKQSVTVVENVRAMTLLIPCCVFAACILLYIVYIKKYEPKMETARQALAEARAKDMAAKAAE